MVALTVAAAARRDARQLRARSLASRLQMRRLLRRSEQLQRQCSVTQSRMMTARGVRQRSTWSDLLWRQPGEDLDNILVPIDTDD